MALLLRHSRKLRRVHGVLDCERGSIARHFSAGACSTAVKKETISSSSVHGEYGKKVGSSSIFQYRQSGKELHTFKVASREAIGSYSSKRMPIAATGVNSLFSCGQVVLARQFSSGADLPAHEEIGMPSLSPTKPYAMAAALRRHGLAAAAANPVLFSAHGPRYRKLEVILTTTIDKLGKAGETVKVAPGHFRNHLMPKMLAVPNIDKFAILMREQPKLYQCEEEVVVKEVTKEDDDARQAEEKLKGYQAAAKRLDNALLVLRRFISEGNELRTPVTKDEIISEVARQLNVNIHPDNLHLLSPLSSLGEFELPLRLPRDIPRPEGKLQWTLNVKIRRP